jgi:hypothetical protein
MTVHRVLSLVTAAWLAAGCATFVDPAKLPPGSTADSVRQRYGPPTGEYTIAGGTRYEYATGPYGRFTWMLDFDPSGTLRDAQQVLTEARFNTIVAGLDAKDLRSTLGRPSEVWRLSRQRQDVWRYRYDTPFCQVFQVGVGDDGKVVDAGYAPDPVCESGDMDRSFN